MRLFLRFSVIILLITSLTTSLSAQYTIGADNGINGSMAYPSPFGDYYKTMRAQYLYRASELAAAGMTAGFINEIRWNVVTLPPSVDITEQYTIKLLASPVSSLGITTWEPGATTVWGPVDYTPTAGINTFVLDVPFLWDGSSNVIVEICGGDDAGTFTKNARVTWTGPLGFNGSHTRQSDIELDPCGYTGAEYYDAEPGGPDYRPQVTFVTSAATDCADLPIIGSATASELSVCAFEPFTVSIEPIAEFGITYSWSSSPNGVTWTTIPGATSPTLYTSQSDPTYFRCTVTCTLSGDNSNSLPAFVGMNDPDVCTCIPTYVTGSTEGDFISKVILGAINNVTGALPNPYYYYYDALSTTLTTGTSNTITVGVGTYATDNCFAAWIDYNQDGVFGAGEKLGEVTGLTGGSSGNVTFTVPVDAVVGTTKMRVREVFLMVGIDPCLEYNFGETEDYNVNIVEGVPPVAAFSFTGDPTTVFTDLTTGVPTSWAWNFGDGGTSTLQNPVHTYTTNGTFNACLTATNVIGFSTACHNVVIDSYLAPVADFTYTGDPTVSFNDNSLNAPTSWNWNFGDGFTSTLENPVHTYATNGSYFVCLTATNAIGSSTDCNTINIVGYPVTPVTDFTYSGEPSVSFTDLSTNIPTYWNWTFGDGFTSTLQNPVHLYAENGTYTVCLVSGNAAGEDSECKNIIISSYPAPVANFSFSGDPVVSFTDLSTNDPATWLWSFDDGGVSTETNPIHTYALNGVYNVCLSVTGAGGSDTYCQDVTVAANGSAPTTDFSFELIGLTAIFTDLSTDGPADWYWDFGDGAISGLQNPVHTYAVEDIYNVCLTTTNDFGFNTNCQVVDLTTGILDQGVQYLTLYPNPAADYTIITGNMATADISTLTLVNALGQEINTASIVTYTNGTITINTQQLAAGAYTISLINEGTHFIGKFVKL